MTKERLLKAQELHKRIEDHERVLTRMRNMIESTQVKDRVTITVDRPRSDAFEATVVLDMEEINMVMMILKTKLTKLESEFEVL